MRTLKVTVLGASILLLASSAQASIFATTLVDHSDSLTGTGLYNDANDLLGKPATIIPGSGPGASPTSHLSIVEPAWGRDAITTFNDGDWAVVQFDHQVMGDPNNPYGLDFIVYGNAFMVGSGYVADNTDHTSYTLTGGAFTENVLVSVSQDGVDWYTYENGPYGDNLFPTNPWGWDPDLYAETGNGWTDVENDYALPVDPSLTAGDFAGLTSYEGMLLYGGSAGGTGFDLAESGYDWIEYIRVEGVSGLAGGEIDAFADVAPVPVPGAAWLLGAGLIGLAGLRRKRD